MAQTLPAATGDAAGAVGRAGTAGDRAGADYARSQGTSQDARGRGKGNGPRAPRCQHRAPRRADASGLSPLLRQGVCRLWR